MTGSKFTTTKHPQQSIRNYNLTVNTSSPTENHSSLPSGALVSFPDSESSHLFDSLYFDVVNNHGLRQTVPIRENRWSRIIDTLGAWCLPHHTQKYSLSYYA